MKIKFGVSKKMLLTYVLFVLLPACTLMYIYYLNSSNIIVTEVTQSYLQTLKQSQINITNTLENVDNISKEIFMDKRIQDFVSDESKNNIKLQVEQVKEIRDMFINIAQSDNCRIRIFIDGEKIASGEKVTFFPLQDVTDRSWYKDVVDHKGVSIWTGVYRETYMDTDPENVISCARVLKHSFNYNDNDGILLIDLPEKILGRILQGIEIGNSNEIYIADSSGRVISHADKTKLGSVNLDERELEYVNNSSEGIKAINNNGREIFLIYKEIEANGWKLIAEVDRKDIIKSNTFFNSISTFILIIITFIIIIFGLFLMFGHTMEVLDRQVKQMVSEAKRLMEESYQAKLSEREAQLKALQAQINPHFLYNTLDNINWMAVKIQATDISFMINSLAKYFRLSLSKGKDIVGIKEELELIKVYLTIQQARFKGAIQFEFRIDESVEKCKIHKLTLQPIIENAIIHGIQKKGSKSGLIIVSAYKEDGDMVITISDDGVGMDMAVAEKILSSRPGNGNVSYGLYNVNERIKLYFGDKYGIKLASIPGEGTTVEVRVKAMESCN